MQVAIREVHPQVEFRLLVAWHHVFTEFVERLVVVRFLEVRMIVVHELAHFKESDHNKAFYKLCEHMMPGYQQAEFDLRVYLTYRDLQGKP